MTENEAYEVMEVLAVAWNFDDDKFSMWMRLMREMPQVEVAMKTAQLLARDSADTFVPGWRVFQDQYGRFARRAMEDAEQKQLEMLSRTSTPTFAEGVAIARKAYLDDCKARHKEPKDEVFDEYLDPYARRERREALQRRPRG